MHWLKIDWTYKDPLLGPMSPRKKAQVAFASAVMLLFLSGSAVYLAITRLLGSEDWVIHSYEVRTALGDLDSAVVKAGRARSSYVITGSDEFLNQFDSAVADIPGKLQALKELTRDNRQQQELGAQLEAVITRRVSFFHSSIQLKKESPQDQSAQTALQSQYLQSANDMSLLLEKMRNHEKRLLDAREAATHRLLILTGVILCFAFLLAITLLAVHHRFLSAELERREKAEQNTRESEESLRKLTGRLLQLQDDERRKFSRELHDSLGQYLASVKMNLQMYSSQPSESSLAEAISILDQSIAETRTISYLLHPPLLDEAGLSSAARWYVEGFAQRSGIATSIDLPAEGPKLPRPVALALFRVLQESLTNIHRHSGSEKSEVTLKLYPSQVILEVRDFGKGISPEVMENFKTKGTHVGVGLAGIRERIRELGGQLEIHSASPGTLISVAIPLPKESKNSAIVAAD
jgi:signal transduction histidine kinase